MQYQDYCIGNELTVRDAMKVLDGISPKIVFIMSDGKLIASLTDGDIRRFLLNGGKLSDLAVTASNQKPRTAYDERHAAQMYHERHYVAIPIVDTQGRIKNIYLGGRHFEEKKATLLRMKIQIQTQHKQKSS